MPTIYKTKHQCRVCHNGIKIKYHKQHLSYYYCDNCNIIYVYDKNLGRMIRAYEPRKTIEF